jgi:hypothetical protein
LSFAHTSQRKIVLQRKRIKEKKGFREKRENKNALCRSLSWHFSCVCSRAGICVVPCSCHNPTSFFWYAQRTSITGKEKKTSISTTFFVRVREAGFSMLAAVRARLNRRGLSSRASRLPESQGFKSNQRAETSPQEVSKGNDGLGCLAWAILAARGDTNTHSLGGRAREPEDHGDAGEDNRDDGHVNPGDETRNKADVEEDEEGPDTSKEDKGHGRTRPVPTDALIND